MLAKHVSATSKRISTQSGKSEKEVYKKIYIYQQKTKHGHEKMR